MNKSVLKRYVFILLLGGVAVGVIGNVIVLPLTLRLFTATFCIGAALVLLFISGVSGILNRDDTQE